MPPTFGSTPPPTAFVPAAGLNFPPLTTPTAALPPPSPKTGNTLPLKNPTTGKTVHLANAGVAHTLNTNLTGNKIFVTA
jgi:hypothetical protein